MYDSHVLIETLERNFGIINAQLAGVTHDESLIQPPFNSNCLNWVMGHIVQNRNKMLQLLDLPTVCTSEQCERYAYNSAPITGGHDAFPLEQMKADLAVSNTRLVEALKSFTPEMLALRGKEVITGLPEFTIGWMMNFLIWHETYHTGQTDILRQASGKNDKII